MKPIFVTRRLIVQGRVQGVGYRAWSAEEARNLGLRGWVRNHREGTVEMVLAGVETDVARMIERCRQGPPAAKVERIDVDEVDEPAPDGFVTRPTA